MRSDLTMDEILGFLDAILERCRVSPGLFDAEPGMLGLHI